MILLVMKDSGNPVRFGKGTSERMEWKQAVEVISKVVEEFCDATAECLPSNAEDEQARVRAAWKRILEG